MSESPPQRRGSVAALLAGAMVIGASASHAQEALPRPIRGELPAAMEEVFVEHPPGIEVTPYATGMEVIWSLEFAPDGRLFIAERPGRVRVVSADGQLDPTPWLTVPTEVRLEDGLLGLALHPEFATQPWVYVFYTFRKGDELVNRVSRFREVNGRGTAEQVLLDDLPSFRIHNGGRLAFGPDDGMLYITLGEVGEPLRSQDLNDLAGSVLRVTSEGAIPADNPWPGSPIWAYGLRNPHGLAFRPSDGALFLADNGPSAEWGPLRIGARDEINIITRGGNYGWPAVVGAPGVDGYEDPILSWIPAVPPGGLVFYDADLMPQFKGDLFYSTLSAQALFRIQFDEQQPDRVNLVERWFRPDLRSPSLYGRLRGIAVGPDGAIYVGTGNHDGRSPLRDGDDRVLRIGPAR